MSSLRKSSDQFRNALSGMTMSSRIISFGLIAGVVVCLCLLIRGNQTVQTEHLFGGRQLGEQEIDAIEMSFSRAGLSDWQRDDSRIKIPTEFRSEYLSALDATAALPMSLRSSVQEAIDKASLFEPTSQRESRESHAKEQDLGKKLAAFADIRDASVEHDLGERNGLSAARTQSASVVVFPAGDSPLRPSRIEMIRELIRGSYAGMRAEDVVVIDTNADVAACPVNDPIARQRCEEEARLEQEIHEILRGYDGIRVSAYVDMQAAAAAVTAEPAPAIVGQPKSKRISIRPDKPQSLLNEFIEAVTLVSGNRSTRLKQREASDTANSETTVAVQKVSPDSRGVHSVRLSIGIPETHYQRVWKKFYLQSHPDQTLANLPPLATAELERLKQQTKANITTAVTPALLARMSTTGAATTVDVWSFPDLSEDAVPQPSEPAMGATSIADAWRPVLLVLSVCAIGWILLTSIRSSSHQDKPPLVANTLLSPSAGGDTKDELTSLVRQHPDLAANALREWVAEAA